MSDISEMLKIERLTKNFRGLRAVSDVSFTVEEGSITGIIGSNGAGKTTVFNMISGVFRSYFRQNFLQRERYHRNALS